MIEVIENENEVELMIVNVLKHSVSSVLFIWQHNAFNNTNTEES